MGNTIKYNADILYLKITKIEIERETNFYVVKKGKPYRTTKENEFHKIFNTYEEAFEFLNQKLKLKVKQAYDTYEYFLKTAPKIET